MIRTLIIDDEAPARSRIKRMLSIFRDIEIMGEAENGLQALDKIQIHKPDAVFLDIEMPELDGIWVAASLLADGPTVVFVTAYDEYALKAFEVCAMDYLLKPITETRLESVVQKLRRIQHRKVPANERLSEVLQRLQGDQPTHR